MKARPPTLHGREAQWRDLIRFVTEEGPTLRLGLVYGRRRHGKSHLLRRLVESVGGGYHLALQEDRRLALQRFSTTVAGLRHGPLPVRLDDAHHEPGALAAGGLHDGALVVRFDDWSTALGCALDALGSAPESRRVLVLDEYPNLRQGSPELDSVVAALMDRAHSGLSGRSATVTLILCGSSESVMTDIASGASALTGRARLEMPLDAFDYRQARQYWGIDDAVTAFEVNAIVGGAPGYRDLTSGVGVPCGSDDLAGWLSATVLNPSHALFREDEYLLREDPRVTVEASYYSLLQAIAGGRVAQGRIAEALGRAPSEIMHHLKVLTTAGFVVRDRDLLASKRPRYRIADPIVSFHHLITRRYRAMLEDRRSSEVWADAEEIYRSKVIGPHFETVCRRWVDHYAGEDTLGGVVEAAGRTQVHDRRLRQSFDLSLAALAPVDAGSATHKTVQTLGEAKASRLGVEHLVRLDRIAESLDARNDVSVALTAKRLLFTTQGFTAGLRAEARDRHDVELIDLERLYEGN